GALYPDLAPHPTAAAQAAALPRRAHRGGAAGAGTDLEPAAGPRLVRVHPGRPACRPDGDLRRPRHLAGRLRAAGGALPRSDPADVRVLEGEGRGPGTDDLLGLHARDPDALAVHLDAVPLEPRRLCRGAAVPCVPHAPALAHLAAYRL